MPTKLPEIALYLEPRALTLGELNTLVNALDSADKDTRVQACRVLHELAAALEQRQGVHGGLRLFHLDVPGCDERISLILHPAIFEPEQWGRTFAEGLLKEPGVFNGKSIVELGTGSG